MVSCACKRSWKLKRSKSALTEAPLSHRKHSSLNASSVVPPLILWLCYITLHHHATHLHNVFQVASSALKNWFSTDALLLLEGRLRRVCADQSEQTGYSGRGALKRQELKQRVLGINSYRTSLAATQNNILNLKMSIICLHWVMMKKPKNNYITHYQYKWCCFYSYVWINPVQNTTYNGIWH